MNSKLILGLLLAGASGIVLNEIDIGEGPGAISRLFEDPEEAAMREYLDPPLIVDGEYGPPRPPQLPNTSDPCEPILSVIRHESNPYTRQDVDTKLDNLKGFAEQLAEDFSDVLDGESSKAANQQFVNDNYKRLYGELDADRHGLIIEMIFETSAERRVNLQKRVRHLSETLDELPAPPTAGTSKSAKEVSIGELFGGEVDPDQANGEWNKSLKDLRAAYPEAFGELTDGAAWEKVKKIEIKPLGKNDLPRLDADASWEAADILSLAEYCKSEELKPLPTEPELEVPPIGEIPTVKGAPRAPAPVDFPGN